MLGIVAGQGAYPALWGFRMDAGNLNSRCPLMGEAQT